MHGHIKKSNRELATYRRDIYFHDVKKKRPTKFFSFNTTENEQNEISSEWNVHMQYANSPLGFEWSFRSHISVSFITLVSIFFVQVKVNFDFIWFGVNFSTAIP